MGPGLELGVLRLGIRVPGPSGSGPPGSRIRFTVIDLMFIDSELKFAVNDSKSAIR